MGHLKKDVSAPTPPNKWWQLHIQTKCCFLKDTPPHPQVIYTQCAPKHHVRVILLHSMKYLRSYSALCLEVLSGQVPPTWALLPVLTHPAPL